MWIPFQWFFGQRTGWIALIGGASNAVIFLGFVAVMEGWERDLRMEPIGAWVFLTLLSCLVCFCVSYGAHEVARFNTDRPWRDKAKTAEDENEELKKKVRDLTKAKENVETLNESLTEAGQVLQLALDAQKKANKEMMGWITHVRPRIEAAEQYLNDIGKVIMTQQPLNRASVMDKAP